MHQDMAKYIGEGVYAGISNSRENIAENDVLAILLDSIISHRGLVYEIGCGSGLLLTLLNIPIKRYCGVDASSAKLMAFKENHPAYVHRVKQGDIFSDCERILQSDCLVSLKGYLSDTALSVLGELAKVEAKRFFMFDCLGSTHSGEGLKRHTYAEIKDTFPQDYTFRFNNYIIVMSV